MSDQINEKKLITEEKKAAGASKVMPVLIFNILFSIAAILVLSSLPY